MNLQNNLSWRNIRKYPGRSIALAILAALMALILFAGVMFTAGLRRGLSAVEGRLGADIMVVSYQTTTRYDMDSIALQGVPTTFYMKPEALEKIRSYEGIRQITPQFYLTGVKSDLCEGTMHIIGFEPESDFVVSPWITEGQQEGFAGGELVAGSGLAVQVGQTLTVYGTQCRVAAKLAQTDTYYDTALFADYDTIRQIIASAKEQGLADFGGADPDAMISDILIDVGEEGIIEEVLNNINLYVRGTVAIQTKNMMSGISQGAAGAANIAAVLALGLFILVTLILGAVFAMIENERRKEFAVLRVTGAPRKMISRIITGEAAFVSMGGAAAGIAAGLICMGLLAGRIGERLGLPFAAPGAGQMAVFAVIAFALTVAGGCLAAGFAARRLAGIDPGTVLRGEK